MEIHTGEAASGDIHHGRSESHTRAVVLIKWTTSRVTGRVHGFVELWSEMPAEGPPCDKKRYILLPTFLGSSLTAFRLSSPLGPAVAGVAYPLGSTTATCFTIVLGIDSPGRITQDSRI
ncbi:hypothetical protein N7495_003890 [Penicillium taxi]|uniref:uncharacterized protein n=1 Tax=Penicillium taxi TaxID=168475 RepID=UPI002545B0D8|nr:uncharacterized protein N7495_003890 [Penicillium taxi]KAJ5899146.1 hypothetical protein N7495_003890 [Penicillium taxi]